MNKHAHRSKSPSPGHGRNVDQTKFEAPSSRGTREQNRPRGAAALDLRQEPRAVCNDAERLSCKGTQDYVGGVSSGRVWQRKLNYWTTVATRPEKLPLVRPAISAFCPKVADALPKSCELLRDRRCGPDSTQIHQFGLDLRRCFANLAKTWQNSTRIGRCWPKCSDVGQHVAHRLPMLTKFGRILAAVSPTSTTVWPTSATLGRVSPNVGQTRPASAKGLPRPTMFGRSWPASRLHLFDNCSDTARQLLETTSELTGFTGGNFRGMWRAACSQRSGDCILSTKGQRHQKAQDNFRKRPGQTLFKRLAPASQWPFRNEDGQASRRAPGTTRSNKIRQETPPFAQDGLHPRTRFLSAPDSQP